MDTNLHLVNISGISLLYLPVGEEDKLDSSLRKLRQLHTKPQKRYFTSSLNLKLHHY